MKATIYHNPACGTSRKTLDLLRQHGADITIVDYLKTPPARDELKRLYDRAGLLPSEGLRAREPLAGELGLRSGLKSEDEILDAIAGKQAQVGWGSQIRSYVMQPYQMVKDLRTEVESGNVSAVFDGDLDQFMEGYLRWRRAESNA